MPGGHEVIHAKKTKLVIFQVETTAAAVHFDSAPTINTSSLIIAAAASSTYYFIITGGGPQTKN